MHSLFPFFLVLVYQHLGLGWLLSCWIALHHLVKVLNHFRTSTTWGVLLLYLKLACHWMYWVVCKHFCLLINHLPCHWYLIINLFLPSMQDFSHRGHQYTISSMPTLLLGSWCLINSLMWFDSSGCCINQWCHWAQATDPWLHSSTRS